MDSFVFVYNEDSFKELANSLFTLNLTGLKMVSNLALFHQEGSSDQHSATPATQGRTLPIVDGLVFANVIFGKLV